MASHQSKKTTDHAAIKKWAEERDGKPSVVTQNGNRTDMVRIDFPGYSEKNLQEISWDEWFGLFEENNLEFVYQEETKDGDKSNFNKLVTRKS